MHRAEGIPITCPNLQLYQCILAIGGSVSLCINAFMIYIPIAREIVDRYVTESTKPPWYIDLLNVNLNNPDLDVARERIGSYIRDFRDRHERITENLDFTTSDSSNG